MSTLSLLSSTILWDRVSFIVDENSENGVEQHESEKLIWAEAFLKQNVRSYHFSDCFFLCSCDRFIKLHQLAWWNINYWMPCPSEKHLVIVTVSFSLSFSKRFLPTMFLMLFCGQYFIPQQKSSSLFYSIVPNSWNWNSSLFPK